MPLTLRLNCLPPPCRSNLINFKRSTATGLISDARDSIGLGFGTNTGYTVYAFATMSALASEQFLLARGQVREAEQGRAGGLAESPSTAACLARMSIQTDTGVTAGWSMSYYYGGINGAPLDVNGSMGLRTLDSSGNGAGAYFSAGITRLAPQVRALASLAAALAFLRVLMRAPPMLLCLSHAGLHLRRNSIGNCSR